MLKSLEAAFELGLTMESLLWHSRAMVFDCDLFLPAGSVPSGTIG